MAKGNNMMYNSDEGHLLMVKYVIRSLFGFSMLFFILGYFTEIASQIGLAGDKLVYTQNCPHFDNCTFDRSETLDNIEKYWAQDIAIVTAMVFLVIGSIVARTFVVMSC